jgi:hypothetical protein
MARSTRRFKRGVLVALLVVALSSVVTPHAALADTSQPPSQNQILPADGVGDSPLVPA